MNREVRAAAAGVATGLVSTFPWELGAAPSLALWAVVGFLVGAFAGRGPVRAGVAYGLALTVTFLYSRFGGSPGDLPKYTLFVLVMCVGGALAGVVTAYAGWRVRSATRARA